MNQRTRADERLADEVGTKIPGDSAGKVINAIFSIAIILAAGYYLYQYFANFPHLSQ
jgi:hypothetical protein